MTISYYHTFGKDLRLTYAINRAKKTAKSAHRLGDMVRIDCLSSVFGLFFYRRTLALRIPSMLSATYYYSIL